MSAPAPERTSFLGAPVRRRGGDEYLTGRVSYTADISLSGMAHVALVRSPHAHARIIGVDHAQAASQPGVLLVLTGEDAAAVTQPIPHNLDPAGLGGQHGDVRCLALGKVVYAGQPVAAVVGETVADAREGAALVEVSYEPLPSVLDTEAALAPDAPILYDGWTSNVMFAGSVGDGEFDAAARAAPHVIEGETRIGRTTSAPIETRCYVADWSERDGRLTWYGTTQNPHPQRWILAQALGIPERQIRVIAPSAGGAFGLKMHGHPEEVLIPLLSRRLGRPVKWVESREECMLASGKEMIHRWRAAHDGEGRVLAVESTMVADHGAVAAGPGWGMAFVGSLAFPTGYSIPVCQVAYQVVVTNKAPWAGARPFGKEAPALVMEQIMDSVATATGIDPLEVRRRNWVKSEQFPYTTPAGLVLDSGDYHGLLDKALERLDYGTLRRHQAELRGAGRYIGIGAGFELMPEGADIPGALVGGYDTVTVRMNPSGEVTVLSGVTSPGGGNETGIAQIVADRLGVDLENVEVVQGDTERTPYGYGNLSSRGLLAGGGAALLAADDIADKLRTIAGSMLHCEAGSIILAAGMASCADDAERAVPVAAVAHAAYSLGYILAVGIEPTLESTRTYKPPHIRHLPDAHGHIQPFASFANAFHLAVVELDPETGAVSLERHVAVHDCGTIVNPRLVEGQFTGGIVMGAGAALTEELVHDGQGHLLSDTFKTYLLPRATDGPPLEVCHQVTPSPFTPLGVKGAGESGFAGAYAAIVGAVNDALVPFGARIDATPVTPARVLDAIAAASGNGRS